MKKRGQCRLSRLAQKLRSRGRRLQLIRRSFVIAAEIIRNGYKGEIMVLKPGEEVGLFRDGAGNVIGFYQGGNNE